MIKSDLLKIDKIDNFDNVYIENQLSERKINFVRWAIVDIDKDYLYVSVSYVVS